MCTPSCIGGEPPSNCMFNSVFKMYALYNQAIARVAHHYTNLVFAVIYCNNWVLSLCCQHRNACLQRFQTTRHTGASCMKNPLQRVFKLLTPALYVCLYRRFIFCRHALTFAELASPAESQRQIPARSAKQFWRLHVHAPQCLVLELAYTRSISLVHAHSFCKLLTHAFTAYGCKSQLLAILSDLYGRPATWADPKSVCW